MCEHGKDKDEMNVDIWALPREMESQSHSTEIQIQVSVKLQ